MKTAGNFQAKNAAFAERNSPESDQLIELDALDLGLVSGGLGGGNFPPPPPQHQR
jgi:hypothetical protein